MLFTPPPSLVVKGELYLQHDTSGVTVLGVNATLSLEKKLLPIFLSSSGTPLWEKLHPFSPPLLEMLWGGERESLLCS